MNNKIKIGACIMVHNMAPLIKACIRSLSWVDGIYVYDDLSSDHSAEVATAEADITIITERSNDIITAFERGELEVRNYILNRAFDLLKVDVLIIADADELFSSLLKTEILKSFENPTIDSMAFTIWHLFDEKRYIHFWEDMINGVSMIDPHVRVIRKGKKFQPLCEDGSHPILEANEKTICLHGPYHFHLKYFNKSPLPNYSLFFLPEKITEDIVLPYLKELSFELPFDVVSSISFIDWEKLTVYNETPHYYSQRVQFENPNQALLHPKYYKITK